MWANMFKLIQAGFAVAPAIFSYLQSNDTFKMRYLYGARVSRKFVMSETQGAVQY